MEALGGYPAKSSNPKAKKLTVLLSMMVGVGCLFLLQTQLVKPRKPEDFYSFEVKDAKGRSVSLEKYRGKVSPHHHQGFESDNKSLQTQSKFSTVAVFQVSLQNSRLLKYFKSPPALSVSLLLCRRLWL